MISILMPARNAGKYLEACLQSIIQQTYVDWELIIVDDHSTDNTVGIIKKYAKADQRIHWYTNKGKGLRRIYPVNM